LLFAQTLVLRYGSTFNIYLNQINRLTFKFNRRYSRNNSKHWYKCWIYLGL